MGLLRQIAVDAQGLGLTAHAMAARIEGVAALLQSDQPEQAALEAAGLLAERRGAVPWMYPPQAALVLYCALSASQPPLARELLAEASAWVRAAAATLPPELASSFVERNPVNAAIAAAVSRQPVAG